MSPATQTAESLRESAHTRQAFLMCRWPLAAMLIVVIVLAVEVLLLPRW